MTDYSPSRDTSNTPSFPPISDCDDLEQNTDGHNTLETNLNITALLYHKPNLMKDLLCG